MEGAGGLVNGESPSERQARERQEADERSRFGNCRLTIDWTRELDELREVYPRAAEFAVERGPRGYWSALSLRERWRLEAAARRGLPEGSSLGRDPLADC